MAPGLVHYYFASKDDLLVAVADWCSHLSDGALADLPALDDGFELLRSRIERIQDLVTRPWSSRSSPTRAGGDSASRRSAPGRRCPTSR